MRRHLILLFYMLFFASIYAHAQKITTICGTGISGNTGDHGPATAALIGACKGIARDASGNLYIADFNNYCVRKIDAAGIITTIAGTGVPGYNGDGILATAAMIKGPYGIAVDGVGNILIAELGGQRIRKVNTVGIISTIAGTGVAGYNGDAIAATDAQINFPRDVAVDGWGNIYIADGANSRVRKIDITGMISTVAGTGVAGYNADDIPATTAKLNVIDKVTPDNLGNIFIADKLNHRIRKVDLAGTITTIAGTGTDAYTGDNGPATAADLSYPAPIVLDNTGNMYMGQNPGSRVRRINAAGVITTFAGKATTGYSGDNGEARHAQLYDPWGIVCNGPGDIYISETQNFTIRLVHDDTVRFSGGREQTLGTTGMASLNALLAVHDDDTGQGLHWSMVTAPAHGTVVVSYNDTATGSTVTPTGLSYMPVAGYIGTDTFRVRVYDEMLADTTKICVTVLPVIGVKSIPLLNEDYIVCPNPNNGIFTISLPLAATVTVTNCLGEEIKRLAVSANNTVPMQLDVPAGTYFISAVTVQGVWSEQVTVVK